MGKRSCLIVFVPDSQEVAMYHVSGDGTWSGALVKVRLGSGESALPVDVRDLVKPLSGDGSGSAFRPAVRKIVLCNAEARVFPLNIWHRDRSHEASLVSLRTERAGRDLLKMLEKTGGPEGPRHCI